MLGDTNMSPSKRSSAFDTFQTKLPHAVLHEERSACRTSTKEAQQQKPRTWQDMTWEVKGGFPKSSEHSLSVLIQAGTQWHK